MTGGGGWKDEDKEEEWNEWKECIMGLNISLSIQLMISPKSHTLHHMQQQQQQQQAPPTPKRQGVHVPGNIQRICLQAIQVLDWSPTNHTTQNNSIIHYFPGLCQYVCGKRCHYFGDLPLQFSNVATYNSTSGSLGSDNLGSQEDPI